MDGNGGLEWWRAGRRRLGRNDAGRALRRERGSFPTAAGRRLPNERGRSVARRFRDRYPFGVRGVRFGRGGRRRRSRAAPARSGAPGGVGRDRRTAGRDGASQSRRKWLDRARRGRSRRRAGRRALPSGRSRSRRVQPALCGARAGTSSAIPGSRSERRAFHVRESGQTGCRAPGASVLRISRAGARRAPVHARRRGSARKADAFRVRNAGLRGPRRPRRGGGRTSRRPCGDPPLVEHGQRGYTPEMQALLARR